MYEGLERRERLVAARRAEFAPDGTVWLSNHTICPEEDEVVVKRGIQGLYREYMLHYVDQVIDGRDGSIYEGADFAENIVGIEGARTVAVYGKLINP